MGIYLHVNLNEEYYTVKGRQITKVCDVWWTTDDVKKLCENADILNLLKIQELIWLVVVRTVESKYYIVQVCGYSFSKGIYCYLVHNHDVIFE